MKKSGEENLPLLELATFVLTCARTSIEEGQRYSLLRFLDIFRRVAELPKDTKQLKDEPILSEIRSEIEKARNNQLLVTDEQRIQFTDRMVRRLTAELKSRSGL